MSARALALAIVVLLALTGAARAATPTELARAQTLAATVWHNPCAEQGVRVVRGMLPEDRDRGAAAADLLTCTIYIDPMFYDESLAVVCTVLLHEYGHLAGYRDPTNVADPEHSSNPASIMSARERLFIVALVDGVMRYGPDVDRRCVRLASTPTPATSASHPAGARPSRARPRASGTARSHAARRRGHAPSPGRRVR